MATTFKPLKLELIEEGRLVQDVNGEFARVQKALCEYLKKWGTLGMGATAEVSLKVKVKCTDSKDGIFTVTGTVDTKIPARPARTTTAIRGTHDDGEDCLFGRASGTTTGDPTQTRLCTEDGRDIDQGTGEVIPEDGTDTVQ